ncbi:unnamed protein product, partial [marine sediment metagenome]
RRTGSTGTPNALCAQFVFGWFVPLGDGRSNNRLGHTLSP